MLCFQSCFRHCIKFPKSIGTKPSLHLSIMFSKPSWKWIVNYLMSWQRIINQKDKSKYFKMLFWNKPKVDYQLCTINHCNHNALVLSLGNLNTMACTSNTDHDKTMMTEKVNIWKFILTLGSPRFFFINFNTKILVLKYRSSYNFGVLICSLLYILDLKVY